MKKIIRNLRSVVCAGVGIHSHNLGTDRAVRNELFIPYSFVAFVNFCSKVFVFPDFRVGFGGPRRLDHTLLASQIELCQLCQLDQLFFDASVSLEACRVVRKEESRDLHRPARLGETVSFEVGQLGQLQNVTKPYKTGNLANLVELGQLFFDVSVGLRRLDAIRSDISRSPICAATCRGRRTGQRWRLETWEHELAIVAALPTLPLWLPNELMIPLELEFTYEETCRSLRIR